MQIRTYTGISLDGFMAYADGIPVWDAMPVLGGAQTIRALLEIGAVDELGMTILPILRRPGTPGLNNSPGSARPNP